MTDIEKPAKGSFWQHHNGNRYTVLMVTNTEGDDPTKREKYPPTVVYEGQNGKLWSRKLADWHRSMTPIYPGEGERAEADFTPQRVARLRQATENFPLPPNEDDGA